MLSSYCVCVSLPTIGKIKQYCDFFCKNYWAIILAALSTFNYSHHFSVAQKECLMVLCACVCVYITCASIPRSSKARVKEGARMRYDCTSKREAETKEVHFVPPSVLSLPLRGD